MDGRTLSRQLTAQADRTITSLFEKRFGTDLPRWTIVALGGYGRMELCPFSDVDILLLTDRRIAQDEIQKALLDMMYPLWDEGYTVGYSVRTIKQTLKDSRKDFFLRTSLLDARFVCGSKIIFDDFERSMMKDSRFRHAGSFLEDLRAHVAKRHEKFGDASYILEPDIKDGYGGLRDYQCIMWMDKIASFSGMNPDSHEFMSSMDRDELEKSVDHLIRIRFALHKISGRKNDRLFFEYQQSLARALDYKGNGYESAPELLMKHFHRSALVVKSISEAVLSAYSLHLGLDKPKGDGSVDGSFRLVSGRLSFSDVHDVMEKPELMLTLFFHMASRGLGISGKSRQHVRDSLALLSLARENPDAKIDFLKILSSQNPVPALTSMLEMGVLERFIPEFETIKGRTQIDVYHIHTTDLHSILTLGEIHALKTEEEDIYREVIDQEALFLAAFLHDIGKGSGRPHAETGAPIAYTIAKWLGFSEDRSQLVSFLVLHHLLLPDIAYKRDLSDEKHAIDCAQTAKNVSTLSMLYLLSVADARATGPRAWNEWKALLLRELYVKALHSLQRGILRDPMNMIVLDQRWKQLISEVSSKRGLRYGGRLWSLPQAYILNTEFKTIMNHLKLSADLNSHDDIRIDMRDMRNHTVLTIIARDRPGLFSMLAGILTINHLDILSSKVFTWLDGIAVDEFIVTTPWKNYTQWNKITEQFRLASSGIFDIAHHVSITQPLKNQPKISSSSDPVITVDNDLSDFFTVIEVHSPRKFGLLFHIARTISSLHLDIHRAFLSHSGDPCTDVFYVVDATGEKISDSEFKHRIVEEILKAI
jgi:[protein-PII] uridylyltransferase